MQFINIRFRGVAMARAAKLALIVLLAAGVAAAADDDVHFDIARFQVDGNTLLSETEIQGAVAPFVGSRRVYGDVQRALEALEAAYRRAGYGTVQVAVPEQELTAGVVRLQVTEAVVGKVTVSGNRHFSEANVRAALPALQEGQAPNMRRLSENIQLSNESPAKQVEVTLGVSDEAGKVDAKVAVAEEKPRRVFLTLDNAGSGPTGNYRLGFAYQDANLFDRDQTVTMAYTTSPDSPSGVKVDIYSIGYRVPFYGLGDSLDFIYGNSNINAPSTALAPGGGGTNSGLALSGKGSVWGLRWNHFFPRRGEYSSRLIAGIDYRHINSTCTVNGVLTAFDPPVGGGSGCTPYTTRPVSLTYAGQRQGLRDALDYSVGLFHNIALGSRYVYGPPLAPASTTGATGWDRYTMISQYRQTPDDFTYIKVAGSYTRPLPADWQARVAVNGQYSGTPLPPSEQIGLTGSQAVRGFNERAQFTATDKGWYANLEIYTPEFAPALRVPGSLRALFFYDLASGYNYATYRPNDYSTPVEKVSIGSIGFGLRYTLRKDVALRMDFAQVVDAGPVNIKPGSIPVDVSGLNTESKGDWRGHMNLTVGF